MTHPAWLDPDPLHVPEPLDPRVPDHNDPPMSPRTKGCLWLAGIGASLIVWVLVIVAVFA